MVEKIAIGPSAVGAEDGHFTLRGPFQDAVVLDVAEVYAAVGIDGRAFCKRDPGADTGACVGSYQALRKKSCLWLDAVAHFGAFHLAVQGFLVWSDDQLQSGPARSTDQIP